MSHATARLKDAADRFVERARRALLDGEALEFHVVDLLMILRDPEARAHLLRLLRSNNPDLTIAAIRFCRQAANELDAGAAGTALKIELIDRAGMAPAAGLLVGGVGLFTGIGSALGPWGMFCGGLIGLMVCGIGRHLVARRALDRRGFAALIREFMDDLRD